LPWRGKPQTVIMVNKPLIELAMGLLFNRLNIQLFLMENRPYFW
jgi:hypothetical protein